MLMLKSSRRRHEVDTAYWSWADGQSEKTVPDSARTSCYALLYNCKILYRRITTLACNHCHYKGAHQFTKISVFLLLKTSKYLVNRQSYPSISFSCCSAKGGDYSCSKNRQQRRSIRSPRSGFAIGRIEQSGSTGWRAHNQAKSMFMFHRNASRFPRTIRRRPDSRCAQSALKSGRAGGEPSRPHFS